MAAAASASSQDTPVWSEFQRESPRELVAGFELVSEDNGAVEFRCSKCLAALTAGRFHGSDVKSRATGHLGSNIHKQAVSGGFRMGRIDGFFSIASPGVAGWCILGLSRLR